MLLSHFLFIFSQCYATIIYITTGDFIMLLSHFYFIFSQRYATILLDYYRRLYYVIKPFPLYFQPTLCHYFIRLLQETLLCY